MSRKLFKKNVVENIAYGASLAMRRTLVGLNQRQLADLVHIRARACCAYEHGENTCPETIRQRFEEVLGCVELDYTVNIPTEYEQEQEVGCEDDVCYGRELSIRRMAAKLSQKELAPLIPCAKKTLQDYELGKQHCPDSVRNRIDVLLEPIVANEDAIRRVVKTGDHQVLETLRRWVTLRSYIARDFRPDQLQQLINYAKYIKQNEQH